MSTIVTDTLQGKTSATSITLPTTTNIGSTPLVSASANSMTIRGEGSATTNIQQGLNKFWNNVDADASSIATRDSFNQSSITDAGTGDYAFVFTNNMANNDYSHTTGANSASGHLSMIYSEGEMNTGSTRSYVIEVYANNPTDSDVVVNTVAGDLA